MKKPWGAGILLLAILITITGCGGGGNKKSTVPPPVSDENLGKILFVSDRDGNYEIYVMDADGANQKRLTNNAAYDSEPAWSPDRRKIAFISTRGSTDDKYRLYVMNADGTEQKSLPTSDNQNEGLSTEEMGPAWSRDGQLIAFSSNREDPNYHRVYTMNSSGSENPGAITDAEDLSSARPSWSPDGRIVNGSGRGDEGIHLWMATPSSGGSYSKSKLPIENLANYPEWSPDGSN